ADASRGRRAEPWPAPAAYRRPFPSPLPTASSRHPSGCGSAGLAGGQLLVWACNHTVTRRGRGGGRRSEGEKPAVGVGALSGWGKRRGGSMATRGQLIPVKVGDIEIEVEAVPVAGTEATSGRAAKAAGNVLEAFGKAQDAIIEVAKSTAQMIDKAGGAARPDR